MRSVKIIPVNSGFKKYLAAFFMTYAVLICPVFCFSDESAPDIALISPDDIQKKASDWIILDARPYAEWSRSHIPGALSFSWEQYTRTDEKGIRYRMLPSEEMARKIGEKGINRNTWLVIYGDADTSWGGEGWACWVFAWLGHKGRIRLLDGGIQAWKSKNMQLESKQDIIRHPEKTSYIPSIRKSLIVTTDEIRRSPESYTLVDTRSFIEWMKGHLPGATRIEWTNFFSGQFNAPLSPEKTRKLLERKGIDMKKPAVYYCTGGIRSGYAWLAHQLAGLPAATNYEEGTEGWNFQP